MSSTLHLVKAMGNSRYESTAWFDSESVPGVRFAVSRMSLGRRIALTRKVREIARNAEFLEAGQSTQEKMEAALMLAEVERIYLEWGLVGIEGLEIDGQAATPETAIERGPIRLAMEMLGRVKQEAGLSEDETKN